MKQLAGLRSLTLSNPNITDAGLTGIGELKQLEDLRIGGATKITDAGMKSVKVVKSLQKLDLQGVPLTDAGLDALLSLATCGSSICATLK